MNSAASTYASVRRHAAHVNWGVLDQGLSSGSNFVLALIVVRSVSSDDFGAFSIAVLLYVLAVGLTRAVTTEPLTIRMSRDEDAIRDAARRCLGTSLVIGVVIGTGCAIAAPFAPGPLERVLLVLAVTLPLLMVQDSGRVICFAMERPRRAAANDALWAALEVGFVAIVLMRPARDVWNYVAAWLVAGALAGVYVLWQLRLIPTPTRARQWLREQSDLGVPLFWNYVLMTTPPYLLFALTPLVATLGELGIARAAYVPFSPFGILIQSSWLLLLPAASRRSRREIARLALWSSAALGALAFVWSLVVAFGIPHSVGVSLIGDSWAQTDTSRILFGCALTAQAFGIGPLIAMRAIERPQDLVRVRMISAPLVLGGGLVLAAYAGAVGVALGIALGDVITTLLSWHIARRRFRGAMAEREPNALDVMATTGRVRARRSTTAFVERVS
jgi:hypothetical protein